MIGKALLSLVIYMAMGLIMNMCLNASAQIGSALMKSVYDLFFNNTGTVYNAGLKILFPTPGFNLGDFIVKISFALMGLCIVLGCIKSMAAPVTGDEAESPISVVGHAVIGTLLMLLFFGNPAVFFSKLQVSPDGSLNIIQIGLNAIKQGFDTMGLTDLMTTNWTLNSASWPLTNPGDYLLGLILSGTLIIMVVRAAISSLERLLSYCLYIALGPICFGMYPLKETRNLAKEWIMSVFAQTIAIFLSMMMWVAFVYRFNNMTIGSDITSAIMDFAICIVILTICEKSEQLLNALGLRTLPNSDAARQAFLGSGLATGIAHAVKNGATKFNEFIGALGAGPGWKGTLFESALPGIAAARKAHPAPKAMRDAVLGTTGARNATLANPVGGSAAAAKASAASMLNSGSDMKAAYSKLTSNGGVSRGTAVAAVGNAESSRIDKFANMNSNNGSVFANADAMKAAGASDLEANAAMQIKNYASSPEMQDLAKSDPGAYASKMSAYSDSVKTKAVQSGLGADIAGQSFAIHGGSASVGAAPGDISNAVFDGKHEFTMDSGVKGNNLCFTNDALGSGNFGADVVQDAAMNFGFDTGSDGKAYARRFDADSMSMADGASMALADRWNKVADSFETNDGACDASYVAHVMGLNNADNVIGTARLCQTEDGSGAAIVMQDKTLGTFAITNGKVEDGSALTYVSGSGSEEKTFDTGYTVNVASGSNVAICKPQPAARGEQFSQSDKFNELLSLDTPMASGKDADQEKSTLKALYNAAKDARIKKKM